MDTLRIGFVDYCLKIAHASMLLRRTRNRQKTAACDVVVCTAMEAESGKLWAQENAVPYVDTVADMKGEVDAIIIPAASHPEHHFALFLECTKLGVPIFIDKPLAPDAATGVKIFKLAREKGIPVFSSSALRFSDEVAELRRRFPDPNFVQAWGGWSHKFDEFVIHPVEAAMALLGPNIQAVSRLTQGDMHHIQLIYPQGRRGDIYLSPAQQAYEIAACGESGWLHQTIGPDIFERLLDCTINAFRTRCAAVSPLDTLAVLKALDACRQSSNGKEVAISWTEDERQLCHAIL